jgi:hypothetical protein
VNGCPFEFVLHPEGFVKPSGHKGKLSVNHQVVWLADNHQVVRLAEKMNIKNIYHYVTSIA